MTMLFSSMFAGISVLWDKEFGFRKNKKNKIKNHISLEAKRKLGMGFNGYRNEDCSRKTASDRRNNN